MRYFRLFFILLSTMYLTTQPMQANTNQRIIYAEQWYNLYHLHLHRYPEDEYQNLIYLEHALSASFSNPLYALAKINTADEWQVYRYLFKLHVNLQIVRTYMALANKYDRKHVYFYNAPWKEQNLKSLEIAENYYQRAYYFWDEALSWVERLDESEFRWIYLEDVSNWHKELTLIKENKLDFKKILDKHLAKLENNRQKFLAMDDSTY